MTRCCLLYIDGSRRHEAFPDDNLINDVLKHSASQLPGEYHLYCDHACRHWHEIQRMTIMLIFVFSIKLRL